MSDYEPSARRPIADAFRSTAHLAVRFCVRAGVHPDTISYGSVVAAAGAAACFWWSASQPLLLVAAPILCYVRLWLNMLDGMVALAAGKASLRGEILNEVPDRVSDVLIFAGIAHSGWNSPFPGYWAAIFAVFTAYIGIFGQAVGARREFGGVMSKPFRMVAVSLGTWLTFVIWWVRGTNPRWLGLTVLDWTCLAVVAGCAQTAWVRLARILASLRTRDATTRWD